MLHRITSQQVRNLFEIHYSMLNHGYCILSSDSIVLNSSKLLATLLYFSFLARCYWVTNLLGNLLLQRNSGISCVISCRDLPTDYFLCILFPLMGNRFLYCPMNGSFTCISLLLVAVCSPQMRPAVV